MSTDTSPAPFNPRAYLAAAAAADAKFLADTRAIITAETSEQIADALTAVGSVTYDPRMDGLMAAAFGGLGFRAEVIMQRLEKAEARVAELEAESDACCPSCDGSRCPGA